MKLPIFLVFALTIFFFSSQPKGDSGKQVPAAPVCKNFVEANIDLPTLPNSRLAKGFVFTMPYSSARAEAGILKARAGSPAVHRSFDAQMQSSRQTAAWSIT